MQGDVVFVDEDCLPRQRWKRGTVEELIHGKDNLVRAAVLWLASEGRNTEIKRPVQNLYPVEVSNEYQDGGHKTNAVTKPLTKPAIRFVPDDTYRSCAVSERCLITQSYLSKGLLQNLSIN